MAPAIGAALIGGGMGMINDFVSRGANRKDAEKQFERTKELMNLSQEQQYAMWLKTNYGAQKEQLEKAGLNPGLLYGMSGGGGTTTGSSSGSAAMAAPVDSKAMQGVGMGIQLELMKAQKENIEADTAKKQVEADVTGGAGMQKTLQEASTIAQDRLLKEAQTRIANIQADRDTATFQDQVDKIKGEAIGQVLTNLLTKSGIEVNTANVNKMAQDIAQGWRRLTIEQFKAEIEANFKDISKIGGNMVEEGYNWIKSILGIKSDQKPLKVDK